MLQAAQGWIIALHHIGSTAVPGLPAKPVLDLLAEVAQQADLDRLGAFLAPLGYVDRGTNPILPTRRYFKKSSRELPVHLHAWPEGDPEIGRHLAFRDRLRCDRAAAERYAEAKRTLALTHHDTGSYADAKVPVIASILGEVRAEASAGAALARLLAVMAALRTPGSGCPWDLAQDFDTIAPYTIEEAYEVADAILRRDWPAVLDECGDLLFQVVYYARMGEEQGRFDFAAIADSIAAKMIARHPHVFGEAGARDAGEQTAAWEAGKVAERARRGETGTLAGIPAGLPALTRAVKLTRRAARVGFDWRTTDEVLAKLEEEVAELRAELAHRPPDRARLEDEFGDVLIVLANLGRVLELDPEACLRGANAKFTRRFNAMERRLQLEGKRLGELELPAMDAAWDAVKRDSRARLRPARASDGPAMAHLVRDAVAQAPGDAYTTAQREAWAPSAEAVAEWAHPFDRLAVVAETEEGIRGFATLTEQGHLDLLYVAPAAQRLGLAGRMLAWIEDEARARGMTELEAEASLWARGAFVRAGWHDQGAEPTEHNGATFLLHRMTKRLS